MNTKIVKEGIDEIIRNGRNSINKREASIKCLQCLDLTSLNSTDNEKTIINLIGKSSIEELDSINVAGICVYPTFLKTLSKNLHNKEVKKVVVSGGFPHGQLPLELKINEVKFSIDNNAEEIDIVMNRGLFLDGNFREVSRETSLMKQVCGDKILKVILEVGDLLNLDDIFKASMINLEAGADFIKTSTGKTEKGADIYSFSVMLEALKKYYENTGILKSIKAAGGISTAEQALDYCILFSHYFGEDNLNPKHFRIGGSRLRDNLVEYILK
ncbi:MAG: deoxyribose-phosphate aldolase [Bacteroidales bacterium]|jgi:deoxyribose-phosphate aldolase|nr:deoxyribose-phosphate aldolase [Bacteroidales bacterium]MDD4703185.1 deoxyribose-phosphate aldolase [Bacteroidales bacterium]MDX9797832.1 deoxyribose-phosphate aldolase [Bacteroidales bacterium]